MAEVRGKNRKRGKYISTKIAPLCGCNKPTHARGLCRNCYERQLKEENTAYKKSHAKGCHDYWVKNKERLTIYHRNKFLKKKEMYDTKKLRTTLLRKYGISLEEYYDIVNKYNNTCYICGRSPYNNRKLHLDHDHLTGKVRGVLCARCNWYLATIEKNPETLNKIKEYLGL
jgi:hypothetical protein